MIDADPAEGAVAMRRLVDIGLVDVVDGDRFQIHDLVRLFGADRARVDDAPTELAAAHHRLGMHYRITMREAAHLIRPSAFAADAAAHGAGDIGMFHDSAGAVAWLDHERANIVALARWAADRTDELSDLAEDARTYTADYLNKGAHLDEMLALAEIAMTVAERAGRIASAADSAGALALAQRRAGRLPDAIATAERGLALAIRAGAIGSEANCLNKLGVVLGSAGRIDEAQSAFDRSAALRRAEGNPYGEAISLHNLADMLLNNARPAPAAAALHAALPLRTAIGDHVGTLLTRFTLAKAQYLLGDVAGAEAMLHESLRLSIDLDEQAQRWQILIVLAQTALRGGDPAVAVDRAAEAEPISRRLGHRYGLLLCARISARAHKMAGRHEESKRYARKAEGIEAEGDFRANPSLELIVPNADGADLEFSSPSRADDLSLL
jgi:tetratricopeptide (TPR) repeat protein